jgi:Xaa-Pro aminopeptidase
MNLLPKPSSVEVPLRNTRIQKLQQMMAKDKVGAALYATSANMQYFLGDGSFFWHHSEETASGLTAEDSNPHGNFLNRPDCIFFIPVNDEPILFLTYDKCDAMRHLNIRKIPGFFTMLGASIKPFIKGKKRVALGESCNRALKKMVLGADNTIEITDAENYGEKLRVIKDSDELNKLRKVAEFTDYSMGLVAKALQPGITPKQVKELIAAIALSAGAQGLSFNPAAIFVQSGAPGSEELFNYPEDEPLKEGTSIGFDYGFILDGYASDYGRSFYCGKNEKARGAYKALQEAQLHLLEKIKPGEPLNNTFDILYDKLETRNLGKYLRRAEPGLIMGHQIGIEVHERPWLRADSQGVFEPGMVLCVEPKIMWPGLCYLRCEDMVHVTETGCEVLTKFDRDYFEL